MYADRNAASQAAAVAAVRPRSSSSTPSRGNDTRLLLRAGEGIWHYEEPELGVAPGRRRPMLVVDEQVTHLAHTDKQISNAELMSRMQSILQAKRVPVDVAEAAVSWSRDPGESRSRVVASLRNHAKSDIKMIFGVDYLGDWASVQMQVGIEPEPMPVEPPFKWPIDGIIALVIGVVLLVVLIGIFAIAYGIWRIMSAKSAHEGRIGAERANRERRRLMERLSRTYKVDDARLFCAAMEVVFAAVVDDIVARGGEIVRIQGGKGEFFAGTDDGLTTRRSNASLAEV